MVCFGIKTKNDKANTRVSEVSARFKIDSLIKNPFHSKMKQVEPHLWVVSIEPIYPPIGRMFPLPLLVMLLFPGTWYAWAAVFISVVMFLINLWWTKTFYFLMFAFVTRGGVRYQNPEAVLERVI